MSDITPKTIIRKTALSKETVDMRIPLKGTPESMEDTDKAGNKIFIHFEEHSHDDTADSRKETVESFSFFKEKRAQIIIYGENKMSVRAVDEFERHFGRTLYRILVAAGRTKAGMTAKRRELKIPTMRTAVHNTTIGSVTAVDHLGDVFHNSISWMQSILNYFIIIFKNSL